MSMEDLINFIDTEYARLGKKYGLERKERVYTNALKLMEEVGELAQQVLGAQSLQREDKMSAMSGRYLQDEVADVLITTLLLAKSLQIDAQISLATKVKSIEERYKSS